MIKVEKALSDLCWTLISDLVITASTLVGPFPFSQQPSARFGDGFLLTVQTSQAVRSTLSQHLVTADSTLSQG